MGAVPTRQQSGKPPPPAPPLKGRGEEPEPLQYGLNHICRRSVKIALANMTATACANLIHPAHIRGYGVMNTTWNDSRFGPGSYEHASQEDRSAPRVPVHLAATLRPAGVRAFQTTIRDLSLGGFTAISASRIDPHTLCWLTIPGFQPIQAEVAWWEAGLVGAAFASLMTHEMLDAIVGNYRGAGFEAA